MTIIETIVQLPQSAQMALAFLAVSIVFTILRKLVKFAILLSVLAILLIVIAKLLVH